MKTSNPLYQSMEKRAGLRNRGYLMELDSDEAEYGESDNIVSPAELVKYRRHALRKESRKR